VEIEQPKELPYIEDGSISEVYADQVRLSHFDGYSIRVELAVARPHVTGQNQTASAVYPCARLVLSPMVAWALQQQLSALIADCEKKGLLKRLSPSSDKKQ
jgi:hypothetical protein